MVDLAWHCRCGAMTGHLSVAPGTGLHLVCHCDSCVRAQRHFGVAASRAEGVGIFQTTPDRLQIDTGAEHLGLSCLSPNGLYRWYATCCDTQIGATARSGRFPFVGLLTTVIADPDALGPVRSEAFVPKAGGKAAHKGSVRMVTTLAGRTIGALVSGRWRQTPFFDTETGAPTATPVMLPKDAGLPLA